MASGSQVGSYVFGGFFVGVWLYVAWFGFPDLNVNIARWTLWGLVGIILAGAIYGSRLATGHLRIGLFVVIGLAVAMTLMGLITGHVEEGWATLMTFLGAGLIVSALPRPGEPANA